jgi:hypothetical protein
MLSVIGPTFEPNTSNPDGARPMTTDLDEMSVSELRDRDSKALDAMIEANAAGQSVKTHVGLREAIRKELNTRN